MYAITKGFSVFWRYTGSAKQATQLFVSAAIVQYAGLTVRSISIHAT